MTMELAEVVTVEVEPKPKDAVWREEGIVRGGFLGLAAGILYFPALSVGYVLLTLPAFLAEAASPSIASSNSGTWEESFFGFLFILIFLFIVGGLPSAGIGAVTGGLLASRMKRAPSATGPQTTRMSHLKEGPN